MFFCVVHTHAFFFLFVSCQIVQFRGGAVRRRDVWGINLGYLVPRAWQCRQLGQTESKQGLIHMS